MATLNDWICAQQRENVESGVSWTYYTSLACYLLFPLILALVVFEEKLYMWKRIAACVASVLIMASFRKLLKTFNSGMEAVEEP